MKVLILVLETGGHEPWSIYLDIPNTLLQRSNLTTASVTDRFDSHQLDYSYSEWGKWGEWVALILTHSTQLITEQVSSVVS